MPQASCLMPASAGPVPALLPWCVLSRAAPIAPRPRPPGLPPGTAQPRPPLPGGPAWRGLGPASCPRPLRLAASGGGLRSPHAPRPNHRFGGRAYSASHHAGRGAWAGRPSSATNFSHPSLPGGPMPERESKKPGATGRRDPPLVAPFAFRGVVVRTAGRNRAMIIVLKPGTGDGDVQHVCRRIEARAGSRCT